MERAEILNEVQDIFRDILDNEEIELTDTTTADDIEEWDSLTHIQLIDKIQKKFNIKFTSMEMISWDNVGDMLNTIIERNAKR